MTDHERLVELAAQAMQDNDRIPEMALLRKLSDAHLQEIIAGHTGPLIVA